MKHFYLSAILAFSLSPLANAAIWLEDPNTAGHAYLAVDQLDVDFWSAVNNAGYFSFQGQTGRLASIKSAAENTFITEGFAAKGLDLWGYRFGATRDFYGTQWYWLEDGASLDYANWGEGQPDNFLNWENTATFWYGGTWNDASPYDGFDFNNDVHYHLGYLVEFGEGAGYPLPAIPEPDTYALLGLGLASVALAARRKKAAAK